MSHEMIDKETQNENVATKAEAAEVIENADAIDASDAVGAVEASNALESTAASEVKGRDDKSLSRMVLNTSAFKAGIVAALVPMFVVACVALTDSGPNRLGLMFWLYLFGLLPFGFGVGASLGLTTFVYEVLYLRLPGRSERDLRWLRSWLRTRGGEGALLEIPASTPLRQLAWPVERGPDACCYVQSVPGKYRVQLQLPLTPAASELMAPCFASTASERCIWAPDLSPDEKLVEVMAKGFVATVMRPLVPLEEMRTLEENALWVLLHRLQLVVWAENRTIWRTDAAGGRLVVEKLVGPKHLDKTLGTLEESAAGLWSLLSQTSQPLHRQISCALFEGLQRKLSTRKGGARLLSVVSWSRESHLPWWVVLIERFHEREETQRQLSHFFLHANAAEIHKLCGLLSPKTRDEVLLSWLAAFLQEGWRAAIRGGVPVYVSARQVQMHKYFPHDIGLPGRFEVWLEVLAYQLTGRDGLSEEALASGEEALLSLYTQIVEMTVPSHNAKEGGLVAGLQTFTLEAWRKHDVPAREAQIARWLETLPLPTRRLLVRALQSDRQIAGALDEALVPLLFVQKPTLSSEERALCLVALKAAETCGASKVEAAIRQGLTTWEPETEARVIARASYTLSVLGAETLRGAISMAAPEGEAEGQLSLTGDEAVEGALSFAASAPKQQPVEAPDG